MRETTLLGNFNTPNKPPATHKTWPQAALVVVGHGSTLDAESAAPTYQHVAELRRRWLFAQVEPAFIKEQPALWEVLLNLEVPEIYIVPHFVSEGYITQELVPREMGLAGATTRREGMRLNYCRPVGLHPSMTHVLLSRATEVLRGVEIDPANTALLIVGHGTDLHDGNARVVQEQAERIRKMNRYGEVIGCYMEQAPAVRDWLELTHKLNVIVLPFFIANGLHCRQDIPRLMRLTRPGNAVGSVFEGNPHIVNGRRLWYAHAVGTEPHLADVIVESVLDFDAQYKGTRKVTA